MEENNKAKSFMVKLSTFIVDKRNLFFLIFAILIIFSMFSRNWGEVEKTTLRHISTMEWKRISCLVRSPTIVLQLALSIDYAIILCNRFKATPYKNCVWIAKSDFSSDCIKTTQEYLLYLK